MRNKRIRRTAALLFAAALLAAPAAYAQESPADGGAAESGQNAALSSRENGYAVYDENNRAIPAARAAQTVDLSAAAPAQGTRTAWIAAGGRDRALAVYEGAGYVDIPVEVAATGRYTIVFAYYVLESAKNNPEFRLEIDGGLPFTDAQRFTLSRIWTNDGAPRTDSRGNELRPEQVEIREWQEYALRDANGLYNDPYLFALEAGRHTIRLYLQRGDVAIADMRLGAPEEPPDYESYTARYAGVTDGAAAEAVVQGEDAERKSEPVLFPLADRSSSATYPNDPAKILLNTIGGANWKFSGEWIEWEIEVKHSGFYTLAFRVRQDVMRGMNSTRRLYLDGRVPFEQAGALAFPYRVGWYVHTPGENGEAFRFYLTEGTHTLRLETVPGEVGATLRQVESHVRALSELYRQILVITGVNPDSNRDYSLEKAVPGLSDTLASLSAAMRSEAARMDGYTGSGSMSSQLTEIARQLDSYRREPYTIPQRLQSLENHISTLGTWLRSLKEQPLEIDCFSVCPAGRPNSLRASSLLGDVWFGLRSFVYSFVVDYDSIGDVYDESAAIDVWVPALSSGREQTNIIKRLIDEDFVPKERVPVNLKLVDTTNTILQATFAGKGPDAALSLSKDLPANWAMRGMLTDLSRYPDYEAVAADFYPSASIPFRYNGGVYALPETQTFYMFFYRTDIFEQLDLRPPETWEDFYDILHRLDQNNLGVGMPSEYNSNGVSGVNDQIFQSMLFQKGLTYYNDDLSATAFDNEEALRSFKEWTAFYTQYGLPLSFAFFNRFRTGEMPCGFAEYTTYNMFRTAAPEIDGLWEMVPIPGTRREDGSVDRTTTSNATGCAVFAKSARQAEGYALLKWWVSAAVQARYATNLEALLGVGIRHPVSSKTAFAQLPWSAAEAAGLRAQWEQTDDIPQIPGAYYVQRSMANAFRKVVYNAENERETLNSYARKMDEEIRRKRTEFGLEGEAR